jgi:hypothetical protein
MVKRGTRETSGTEKEELERVSRLAIGKEMPSAVRIERGNSRERREDNAEESKVIRKKLQNPRPTKMYVTVEMVII